MKTKRQLAAEICKREGKKSQAHMGDVMEILTVMEQIEAETGAHLSEHLYSPGDVCGVIKAGAEKIRAKLAKKKAVA